MTIPRVWSSGLADTASLTAANMASLDTNVQRAMDKSGAATVTGVLTVASGAALSVDNAGAFNITGSTAYLATASGGRVQCNDGDVPLSTTSRSFTRMFLPLEAANLSKEIGAGATYRWNVDNSDLGIAPTVASSTFWCPISRAWDGATLASVSINFVVSGARAAQALPFFYPSLNVYRIDPTGVTANVTLRSNVSGQGFTPPANMTAYINGGTPNVLTYTCTANNVIDVSKYAYVITVKDESYDGGFTANKFMGASMSVNSITDLRFQ